MAERFAGKAVMITGAASGLGRAAAESFAAMGARLALSDRRIDMFDAADWPEGTVLAAVDVSEETAVARHVAETCDAFGHLDIAINNAGIGGRLQPLTEISQDRFAEIMAINAGGVFLGMKHQLPPMIAAGQGAILNVASAAGLVGAGHMAAYAASKHAVVGLTRSAADEVARHGVRVNAICPSFAETPLYRSIAEDLGEQTGTDPYGADRAITKRIPMRRVARPEEIVQAMLWAVDPANSFMTGQAIAIDGGLTAI